LTKNGYLELRLTRNEPVNQEELAARVGLYSIPGVGSGRLARLVGYFGSGVAAWKGSDSNLREALGSERLARVIVDTRSKIDYHKYFDQLVSLGIWVSFLDLPDTGYPQQLAQITRPPFALLYRGSIVEADNQAVAVVGTRKPTSYGRRVTETLVRGLVERGVTIVSGLARGVDGIAHRTALAYGGRTIALLGCSIDTVYPPEHRELAERIVQQGALLSVHLPGVPTMPGQFAARNRIIAGLSMGVLVTEAAAKSGTQITVEYAIKQSKPIFAVPGELGRPMSEGPLSLVKRGAYLVTSIEDVANHLPNAYGQGLSQSWQPNGFEGDAKSIVEQLLEGPKRVDNLVRNLNMSVARVNEILLSLELDGVISRSGDTYSLQA
jgi:DNA processing protein